MKGVRNSGISVVIPVKNAEKTITRCLEAVFSQSCPPLEVIVVDGHSSDKTVENVLKFPVKIVYEDYCTIGGARQVGLENARGDFIAFTDADCIPEKDWLENLVIHFDGHFVGVGGSIKNIGEGVWKKSIAYITDTFLGSGNSVQGRIFKEKKIVKSISGCNSMFKRENLIKIGGFNISLSINEETELNKRLSKMGELLYTPDAIVVHDQDRGLKSFANRMYQFGQGRGKLRLWNLQCIPALIAVFMLMSLLVTPWILIGGIIFYVILLLAHGINVSLHKKGCIYTLTVPIVYFIEHLFYAMGFWRGLLTFQKVKTKND
ncbi:MAG: glycosyltransferase [Candidatus Bathyarchaeota archaeon]|nr:glycosyltransferase [Candidatus Bathyarchaeum tardum]